MRTPPSLLPPPSSLSLYLSLSPPPSLDLYLYLHFFRLHCTVPPVLPRRRCAHRAPPLSLKTYNYGQFPALNRSRPTTVVNFQP